MLETEVARVNSSFAQVAQKLKDLQRERGKEVDGLQEELLSAQHSLEQQRAQLQDAAAKMQSGQLDQENRGISIESLRSKLTEAYACTYLAVAGLLVLNVVLR
jgi:Skp family chaperone for outer membrane proteins